MYAQPAVAVKEPEKQIKKPRAFKSYTRPTSSKKPLQHRPSQV
jgi:hypothetical protein